MQKVQSIAGGLLPSEKAFSNSSGFFQQGTYWITDDALYWIVLNACFFLLWICPINLLKLHKLFHPDILLCQGGNCQPDSLAHSNTPETSHVSVQLVPGPTLTPPTHTYTLPWSVNVAQDISSSSSHLWSSIPTILGSRVGLPKSSLTAPDVPWDNKPRRGTASCLCRANEGFMSASCRVLKLWGCTSTSGSFSSAAMGTQDWGPRLPASVVWTELASSRQGYSPLFLLSEISSCCSLTYLIIINEISTQIWIL